MPEVDCKREVTDLRHTRLRFHSVNPTWVPLLPLVRLILVTGSTWPRTPQRQLRFAWGGGVATAHKPAPPSITPGKRLGDQEAPGKHLAKFGYAGAFLPKRPGGLRAGGVKFLNF